MGRKNISRKGAKTQRKITVIFAGIAPYRPWLKCK